MLAIGCLCGSTLFWVAKSSLDDICWPNDIFLSFGQPKCWRNPCVGAWPNGLLLSLGFLSALTDAVPSASSAGLLPRRLREVPCTNHCSHTPSVVLPVAARRSCSAVLLLTARQNKVSGAWSRACGMPPVRMSSDFRSAPCEGPPVRVGAGADAPGLV